MTEQPTEQCVQIFLRRETVASAGGGDPAAAFRMLPNGNGPNVAKLAATRPERLRKDRRSIPLSSGTAVAAGVVPARVAPARVGRSDLLMSTGDPYLLG